MRPFLSILKATALEILSEPLTLLVLLAALALAVLAPAFHYHQFGDPTRMARDAGFSALLTCGSAVAVFCTIRAFRREIESGTMDMALAHAVSRSSFFLAKAAGAFLAYLVFATTVLGVTMVMFEGAAIGGVIAKRTGDIARIFGPCLAVAVAVIVVPLVLGAILNRFARCRFVLSAVFITLALATSAGIVCGVISGAFVLRLVPVALLITLPTAVLLAAAAAFATRLKANAAAAAVGVVLVLLVPMIGNYYLVDALARSGSVPWHYLALAVVVTLPAIIAFLLLGVGFAARTGERP